MEFSDLYLTADDYFAILREAWEKSEFFDGWDRNWHPEDLHNNLEAVFDGVGCGLTAYTHMVGKKVREQKQYNPDKKTVDDMLDQSKRDVKVSYGPSFTGNHITFGDNV